MATAGLLIAGFGSAAPAQGSVSQTCQMGGGFTVDATSSCRTPEIVCPTSHCPIYVIATASSSGGGLFTCNAHAQELHTSSSQRDGGCLANGYSTSTVSPIRGFCEVHVVLALFGWSGKCRLEVDTGSQKRQRRHRGSSR